MCLAGLPVLNGIAPTVEALTESLINMTPLKPSPEEVRQSAVTSVALTLRNASTSLEMAYVAATSLSTW